MKQRFCAVLLILMLVPALGMAETENEMEITVDFEGEWAVFEDAGLEVLIPEGWIELDMMAAYDMTSIGFGSQMFDLSTYRMYADEPMAQIVYVAVVPVPEDMDLEAMSAELEEAYGEEAGWGVINGKQLFAFVDEETGVIGTLIPAGEAILALVGQPLDNQDFVSLFEQIVASVSPIEA